MNIIEWSDSYSVKIESIDDQHKNLFKLLNEFYRGINNNDSKANLVKLIHGLKDYSMFHFAFEEKYMKKFDFNGYKEHKAEHDKFIKAVNDYVERVNSGKLVISIEITNFIKNWIFNHVNGTDKNYSDFFIANGVK